MLGLSMIVTPGSSAHRDWASHSAGAQQARCRVGIRLRHRDRDPGDLARPADVRGRRALVRALPVQSRRGGRWVSLGAPLAILGIGLAAPFAVDATAFPDAIGFSFRSPVNQLVSWITDTFQGITLTIKDVLTSLVINPLEGFLTSAPWWLIVAIIGLIAWAVPGGAGDCRGGHLGSSSCSACGTTRCRRSPMSSSGPS
jgi:hypothetical protein